MTPSVFADLHASGTFVLPNPRDIGEARLLVAMGFPAVATTSAGFAATLGRPDQSITFEEVLGHVEAMTASVEVPVSVDAEHGYADAPEAVAETVRMLADVGAAGVSIEDWNPVTGALYQPELAADRIEAAANVAAEHDLVLTARCEALLYDVADLAETVRRLQAYAAAGAGCLYAPGPRDLPTIRRLVSAADVAVNVLAWPGGPTVDELAAAGVRRVSLGSWLSRAAAAAVVGVARSLADGGGLPADHPTPPADLLERAWVRE